jgi:hypothetical protein
MIVVIPINQDKQNMFNQNKAHSSQFGLRPKELARGLRAASSHSPRDPPSAVHLLQTNPPTAFLLLLPLPDSPSPESRASLASAFSRNPKKKTPASSPRPRSRTPLAGGRGYGARRPPWTRSGSSWTCSWAPTATATSRR